MKKILLVLVLVLFYLPSSIALADWPNKPAGMTVISDHNFNTLNGNGWVATFPLGGAIVSDSGDPESPPNAYKTWWFHTGDGNSAVPNLNFSPANEVFIGFTWKPSNPFTGWANNNNKVLNIWTDVGGIYWYHGLKGSNGTAGQGGPYKSDIFVNGAPFNGHLGSGFLIGPTTVQLGVWHRVEIYWKHSTTPTSQDGIVKYWLDGILQVNQNNVNFNGTGFNTIQLAQSWDSEIGRAHV